MLIVYRVPLPSPRWIVALGVLGLLVYAYPGYMSYDSCEQLAQARAGSYGDWHPPAMAALWRLVEHVVTGSLGMLVLQVACFASGVYLVLARAMPARAAALCTVGVLWFPPIAVILAVIWKDSQMLGYAMLGVALVVDPRRGAKLAGLALLALASAMRHNALAMTLPLLVVLFRWSPADGWRRRTAIAVAAWIAITGAAQLANRALTDKQEHVWQTSLAIFDVAGTLELAGADDAEIARLTEGMPMRAHDQLAKRLHDGYSPRWMFKEIDTDASVFRRPANDAEVAGIASAFVRVVEAHPTAYLAFRWKLMRQVLSVPGTAVDHSTYHWFLDIYDKGAADKFGHDARTSPAQNTLQRFALWIDQSYLFRAWWYAIAAALLLGIARDRMSIALLASALVSEAALYLLAPTPDFRYSIWLVVATLLAAILNVPRLASRVSRRYRAVAPGSLPARA